MKAFIIGSLRLSEVLSNIHVGTGRQVNNSLPRAACLESMKFESFAFHENYMTICAQSMLSLKSRADNNSSRVNGR
jgi:hypothetical protein